MYVMLHKSRVVHTSVCPRSGRPPRNVPWVDKEKDPALLMSLGTHVSVVACEAHHTSRGSGVLSGVITTFGSLPPNATRNFSGVTADAITNVGTSAEGKAAAG